MNASELAELVGGRLAGDDRAFSGVAPLPSASPAQAAYAEGAVPDGCHAGVLLARAAVPGRTVVVVDDPKAAFIRLLEHLFPEVHAPGVMPGAHVHPSAKIAPSASIYPGVVIGAGCAVGEGSILFPNVVLYPGTIVGRDCRVHAGVVLGADGFSYHRGAHGVTKVPQVGRVRVEDGVEIGANSTIDRAFLEETLIGAGAKIDNLVQVGHNSRVGRRAVLAAQTGLSGSVTLGDGVVLAGQVGVADHVEIGPGAVVGAQSGVSHDLPGGERYLGSPAVPAAQARRIYAVWKRLPELWRAVFGKP